VGDLELFPGQGGELVAQGGLVALDREQPVRAASVQVFDVVAWVCRRPR